jgi:hypothetical protein
MRRSRRWSGSQEPPRATKRLAASTRGPRWHSRAIPPPSRGRDYATLVPLAEALERKQLWIGATVVYRALLVAILDRAYASAYHHAARYWARLGALAPNFAEARQLKSPGEFEARIRAQHKRKSSFWAHVSGAGQADDGRPEDADAWVDRADVGRW